MRADRTTFDMADRPTLLEVREPWRDTVLDGRFRIVGVIGEGGMGVVYEAVQLVIERPVAIKMIRRELDGDAATVRRLLREVSMLARLNHPNIVNVIDAGETETGGYIAMERLCGTTLEAALAPGRFTWRRACAIATQLCDALVALHACGIVHRDLKPANIMLVDEPTRGELVKVLDFGLAKSLTAAPSSDITIAGVIVGTPEYMAPESIDGGLDPRIDLYALGCILHEMLAGTPPFPGDNFCAVLAHRLHGEPPPLPGETPHALVELVRALLAKSPDHRPRSAAAVRESLRAIARSEHAAATIPPLHAAAPPPTASARPHDEQTWPGLLVPIAVLLCLMLAAFAITVRW
jgi:serine/threonine-protein kinase